MLRSFCFISHREDCGSSKASYEVTYLLRVIALLSFLCVHNDMYHNCVLLFVYIFKAVKLLAIHFVEKCKITVGLFVHLC